MASSLMFYFVQIASLREKHRVEYVFQEYRRAGARI